MIHVLFGLLAVILTLLLLASSMSMLMLMILCLAGSILASLGVAGCLCLLSFGMLSLSRCSFVIGSIGCCVAIGILYGFIIGFTNLILCFLYCLFTTLGY